MKIYKSLYLFLIAIFLNGCTQDIGVKKSRVVPAADLTVEIDQDRNGNYIIDLNVENLATPEDLTPAKSAYVVWVVSEKGSFNMGQILVNKNLKGSLKTVTPFRPSSIKITAEDDPLTIFPSAPVVLRSEEIIMD
jgi:hypothetical protein